MEQKLIFGQIPPQEVETRQHAKIGRIRRKEVNMLAQQKEIGAVQPQLELTGNETVPDTTQEPINPETASPNLANSPLAEVMRQIEPVKKETPSCGDCGRLTKWSERAARGGKYICPHCGN